MSIDAPTDDATARDGTGEDALARDESSGVASSGEAHEPSGDAHERSSPFACGICERSVDAGEATFLASYPTTADAALSIADADGCLALCQTCTDEVTELTDAWATTQRPPVGDGPSIAAGYRSVADDCSFCGNAVGDGPVLGVESWTGTAVAATDSDATDQHALCGNCVPVFEEFLRGIRSE